MFSRKQIQAWLDKPRVEWGMLFAGLVLIGIGVLVAPIPGPGGIFFLAPGLALVLRSSVWFKRHYVRVKRWQPKAGRWMDWALRRPSARRREAIRKAEEERQAALQESGPRS